MATDRTQTRTQSRTWGIRLSGIDIGILAFAVVGAAALWPISPQLATLLLFVVGHFFLFCNVVRLRRRFELIWGGAFVLLVAIWQFALARDSLIAPMSAQLVVTVAVVLLEVVSPRYHGVWAGKLNGRLGEYLRGEIA